MTAARTYLAGIKERAGAATAGPWEQTMSNDDYPPVTHSIITGSHGDTVAELDERTRASLREGPMSNESADAYFIAHSRTDLPKVADALLAVLELHYEGVAYADDVPEGGNELVPEDYERHYCHHDGETWPCEEYAAITEALEAGK